MAFSVSVLFAVLFLAAAAFLPQTLISDNVRESAVVMYQEGCYPTVADHKAAARLDNWTDALMLMESDAMNSHQIESVFTNPRYRYGGDNPVDDFAQYINDENPEPTSYYVRYWMGFRSFLRLLLVFLDYYQIKRYLAVVFFALFIGVVCSVSKQLDSFTGWLFAISVILVRPYMICNSLQFSCCFHIAFASMLLVPWIVNNPKYEKLFFMELGLITMYFDFYTTPLVTFGFPFVYMNLIRIKKEEEHRILQLVSNAMLWLLGYGGMWIAKLLLTQLFTTQDAFANGFSSFFRCTGIVKADDWSYNVFEMFKMVAISVFSDWEGVIIGAGLLCTIVVWFAVCLKRGDIEWNTLYKNLPFLLPAILPIIWFIIATEPMRIHYWFQYRSVAVIYWTIGGYFSLILMGRPKSNKAEFQKKQNLF